MCIKGLKVTYTDWLSMRQRVQAATPFEACGLLVGRGREVGRVIPIENVAPSAHRYRMNPAQQIQAQFDMEANGVELLAIYHSHPEGGKQPSAIDIAEWRYPGVCTVIWSRVAGLWDCNAHAITGAVSHPVQLTVIQPGRGRISPDRLREKVVR
jgi:proteasome lid subunit RPN8/RPN11